MKRMICCESGARDFEKMHGMFKGEHIKIVRGVALENYVCDTCVPAHDIKKGAETFAVSVWADYGGVPYREWEHEFLEID